MLVVLAACVSCTGDDVEGSPPVEGDDPPPVDEFTPPADVFLGDPLQPMGTAIYVNGDEGDDAGDGSRQEPLASLDAALELAGETTPPVEIYLTVRADEEPYVPPSSGRRRRGLNAFSVPDGVSIFGGYATDWTPSDRRSHLRAGSVVVVFSDLASEVALTGVDIEAAPIEQQTSGGGFDTVGVRVSGAGGVIALNDVDVRAASTTVGNSYGIRASGLSGFLLTNAAVSSGNAGNGQAIQTTNRSGRTGADGFDGGDLESLPTLQEIYQGGPGGVLDGQPEEAEGGKGGEGGQSLGEPGESGERGGNGSPKGGPGGRGGFVESDLTTRAPRVGEPGDPGIFGSSGLGGDGLGTVGGVDDEFLPAVGRSGQRGDDGGGGGGGGGARAITNFLTIAAGVGGGGGGGGGEGGPGGQGGPGGHGSLALFLHDVSSVRVANSRIVAGNGGDGADGQDGGEGGPGGEGGGVTLHINSLQGADGGDGGRGGRGGDGGDGGGGPSYGVWLSGETSAMFESNDITSGNGGAGGQTGRRQGGVENPRHGRGGASYAIYQFSGTVTPSLSGNNLSAGEPGVLPKRGESGATNF